MAVPARLIEDFVRGYSEKAYKFAYRLCGDGEQARELVQEAFVRLWDRIGEHDPARPLDAWYFRILRNIFLDARRRGERRATVSLDAPVAEGSGETFAEHVPEREEALLEALERRDRAESLRAAFESLTLEHRAILSLCDVEGQSYEDAAEALALPLGTVRSRISRARLAFRRAVLALEVT